MSLYEAAEAPPTAAEAAAAVSLTSPTAAVAASQRGAIEWKVKNLAVNGASGIL
jgi:hypothetical protein